MQAVTSSTQGGEQLGECLVGTVAGGGDCFVSGQLDLERHRGRTPGGDIARVMQHILALTAAIWHNDATGQTVLRSLIAYDH